MDLEPPAYVPSVHDEEDVTSALERETHDGAGFESEDELPEGDFEGEPEQDPEAEEADQ